MKIIPLKRGFTEIQLIYNTAKQNDCIICGGYARYCASPLPTNKVIKANDIDLFPKSEKACDKMKQSLIDIGYKVSFENHICYTMKPIESKKEELQHIPQPQIIKPVIEGKIVTLGTMEEILNNFDFTVVRAGLLSSTEIMVDDDFEEDEKNKILRLKNIHCPITSMLRCCKYAKKGYFMRPAEALKLFIDWTNRGEAYQNRIIALFTKSGKGKQDKDNLSGITQEEIDELEALLRID